MNAIQTDNLTKTYQDRVAVDRLNLQVKQGELFALLGLNGAGKTTTVKLLSCLTAPTGGQALVGGHSVVTDSPRVKALIGVSPQETAVAPHLTVRENLALMAGIHGLSPEKTQEKLRELARQFSLEPVLNQRAKTLSGGYARRVSIAMALVSEPAVLFLDEPTLGLDVIARRELWEVIRTLKGRVTVLLTTHYMEEAAALSDRIGVMKDGRLLTVGTAEELLARTGTDTVENAFVALVKEVGECE